MKTELFIIAPGLWQAATAAEVSATCDALQELGAYHLPYDTVTVRLRANEFMSFINTGNDKKIWRDWKHLAVDATVSMDDTHRPKIEAVNELNGYHLDVTDRVTGFREVNGESVAIVAADGRKMLTALQCQVREFLIAILATRNAVKERKENKLARLGIGKSARKHGTGSYRYVTTISLPHESEMEDDTEHAPSGKTKAPHLRRGHIRNQHYGPAHAFIKRVWIAPVFVNADPDFVSPRKAYNVSLPATERTDERHGQD